VRRESIVQPYSAVKENKVIKTEVVGVKPELWKNPMAQEW
jgi:hypothetical protein